VGDDALRTLELLWGKEPAPKRGPNQKTSVAEIVAVAIGLADRDGLSGVTMRAVGERLERTAMSLYTYVPGREVLIALMYDRAHSEVSDGTRARGGRRLLEWRWAVMAWCAALRDMYVQHPWILEVSQARPTLGPHEQEVVERLLVVLARQGVAPRYRRAVVSVLFSIARESAKRQSEMAAQSEQEGEWWAARAAALQAVSPDFATRFPESVALAADQAGLGPKPWVKAAEEAFTDAVTLLLDGLQSRLTDR
jgi:AcrR family transcriptional regulator